VWRLVVICIVRITLAVSVVNAHKGEIVMSMTHEEQVKLSTDIRYALRHGCLSRSGLRHDDPARHKAYAYIKLEVTVELGPQVCGKEMQHG